MTSSNHRTALHRDAIVRNPHSKANGNPPNAPFEAHNSPPTAPLRFPLNMFHEMVALFPHLGCRVCRIATVRRAEEASARVPIVTVAGVAEVRQLDPHVRVEQHVLAADVSMRDPVQVTVGDSFREFLERADYVIFKICSTGSNHSRCRMHTNSIRFG